MSDATENEQIRAALEAAQAKVRRGALTLIGDGAAPAIEGQRTSFDGGARGAARPITTPEEAHQQFIAGLLRGDVPTIRSR